MKTVVGLFDSWSQAQGAINELIENGCQRDAINIMATDDERQRWMGEEEGYFEEGVGRGMGKYSFISGGFSSLITLGIEEQDAQLYAEAVNGGGFLVAVSTDDQNAQKIADILNRYGAIDIDQRRSGIGKGIEAQPLQQSVVQEPQGQRPIDVVDRTRDEFTDRPFSSRENATTPLASQQPYVKEDVTITGQSVGRDQVVTESVQQSDLEVEKAESRYGQQGMSSVGSRYEQQDISSTERRHGQQDISGVERRRGQQDISQTESLQGQQDVSGVESLQGQQDISGVESRYGQQDISAMDDDEFMRHFISTYGQRGERFDEPYRSAYHFAESESVSHPQLQDKEWFEVEEDVHRDWELSHPGTWNKVQDAIHFGWDRNLRHHGHH